MRKLLIPCDGEAGAMRAIDHVVGDADWYRGTHELHLLNVQHSIRSTIGQFVDADARRSFFHDEGMKALAQASTKLRDAGLAHETHIVVDDDAAEGIAKFARERGFDGILVGVLGRKPLSEWLHGGTSARLVRLSDVPVTFVR